MKEGSERRSVGLGADVTVMQLLEEAASQGIQAASRSWKRQETNVSLEPPEV